MSDVTELADAEAARAEAEDPAEQESEDAPTPTPEPEPEPEPAPEPPQPAEGQMRDLSREALRHEKAVRKIIGDDVPLVDCPACEGMGLVPPGTDLAPTFKAHEQFRECDACDGLGRVLTGSRIPGAETADCPKCVGRGFLERMAPPALVKSEPEQYGAPSWMGTVNTPGVG